MAKKLRTVYTLEAGRSRWHDLLVNKNEDYVYTLTAVRSRLRRGHKSVLLFWPNNGALIKVTESNFSKLKKIWKQQQGQGF